MADLNKKMLKTYKITTTDSKTTEVKGIDVSFGINHVSILAADNSVVYACITSIFKKIEVV